MAYRKVREWPNSDLKLASRQANMLKDQNVVDDLLDTFKIIGGYGLAAPQIGLNVRIIVINPNALRGDSTLSSQMLMVNPRIIERKGKRIFRESCFSLPELSLDIERSVKVKVGWEDTNGKKQEGWFEDYAAACVQHEIDHLDGILTIDKISQLRRSMIIKKIKKKNLTTARASQAPADKRSKQKSLKTRKKNRLNRKTSKR